MRYWRRCEHCAKCSVFSAPRLRARSHCAFKSLAPSAADFFPAHSLCRLRAFFIPLILLANYSPSLRLFALNTATHLRAPRLHCVKVLGAEPHTGSHDLYGSVEGG